MTTHHPDSLRDLIQAAVRDEWGTVVRICRRQIASGSDIHFWTLQLAFANFLWQGNVDAHDVAAARIVQHLADEFPSDPNILFWNAYILYITTGPTQTVIKLLDRVLQLDPDHGYANLVKAGYLQSSKTSDALILLGRVLRPQPGNRRALLEIMELASALGRSQEALAAAQRVMATPPFVEESLGCMNDYANRVLTLSTQSRRVEEHAARVIASHGTIPRLGEEQ